MAGRSGFSQWRRIAMATWQRPRDPMIRVQVDLDAAPTLAYLDVVREATGVHVTFTHLVGRATALAIATMPDINGRIVGGSFLPSPTIDVFFVVSLRATLGEATGAPATDLSGAVVRRVDEKPPWEVARELAERSSRIRTDADPSFRRSKSLTRLLPPPLLGPLLAGLAFVTEDLALPIPPLGLEARQFGSVMVSNVGMFGVQSAFAPAPAIARGIGTVVVGETHDSAVVRDGAVTAAPVLPVSISLDHRYLDGYQGAMLAHEFKGYFDDPAARDPLP